MIPILFEKNETAFADNGIGRLRDCLSCVVTEERNGIYECDFEYPVAGANYEKIICGRIVGVTHDESGDIQPFEIVSYSKPINGVVTFHAVHISYRLRGYVVAGSNISSLDDALAKLEEATPENNFTYEADFTSTGYMSAFDGVPKSVRSLLGGVEGSILDTYGGEYEWDKFSVKLHEHRGETLDFAIRYGVNMLDYNEEVDFSDTYTSAVPYWIGDDGNGGQAIIKGDKVEAGVIPYNGLEKCAALDLSDKFETQPTTAQLETFAMSWMASKNTSLPKQSIKVDFVRLSDYEEFAQFERLLRCKLCDSIQVIFPDYQMSAYFKIVRTEYNVLEERFSSMELGSLSTTLAEALGVGEGSGYSSSGGGGGGGINPADFVVQQGTSGIWSYRKWVSGKAECWARTTFNGTSISTSWGSGGGYYAQLGSVANYPVTFTAYPEVNITLQAMQGRGWGIYANDYSMTNVGTLYVYAPATYTNVNITVNIHAIGTWDTDEWDGAGGDWGVAGVKGNAETTYRTGNVNLTPANIGAQPTLVSGTNIKTINGNSLLGSGDITISGGGGGGEANVLEGVQLNGTDLTIINKKVNIPVFTGATSSANGSVGLVPQPNRIINGCEFLSSDGRWRELYLTNPEEQEISTNLGSGEFSISNASTSASGLMSKTDKAKLDGIPSVTTADNGKVMRVVNGVWTAVALPSASGVNF